MFSAKMKARLTGAALAGALLAMPGAALAGVVVKSTGPSSKTYPVGMKIDDDASITLKAGDSVTVLTSKGTKVMKGAGTFVVGEKPKATRARFSALTRKRAADRVRTGAIRGETGAEPVRASNPNLWYLDVEQQGTFCVYDLADVRLWRPTASGIATYQLSDSAGATSVNVTFDTGESVAPLDPALITLSQGESYAISAPGGEGEPVSVSFALIEGDYRGADQLAEALFEAGCVNQVALLADRLEG